MSNAEYERGFTAGFKAGWEAAKGSVMPPVYSNPGRMAFCNCPIGTMCCNAACPHRPTTICDTTKITSGG